MFPLQNPLIVVALLAAAHGTASTVPAIGDTRLFVPPAGPQELAQIDTGTDCIVVNRVRSTRIISGEGIVYQMAGRKTLINRPRHGGKHLERNQILITRIHGSLLCAGDIVHLADGLPGMTTGFVALGRFETFQPPARQ